MFSRLGSAAFKKDLTNIRILCQHLGNPHEKFASIHVAGTNGKGSVSHMLSAIMQTAGYKTGLYTSPHLKDFRERIRINGAMIEKEFVVSFVEKIKPIAEEIQPSFFEITVAMAFEYFAAEQVEVAVVEVGLGGRLDSTNIVLPELSIITQIGLDHTQLLGDTLEAIAAEKGGIIKEGVPVVIGERHELTALVFTNIAFEKQAPIFFAQDFYEAKTSGLDFRHLLVTVQDKQSGNNSQYQLDLPGIYQAKNILPVLKAVDVLRSSNWAIEQSAVETALSQVKKLTGLSGRWEVVHDRPTLVLEVAHNEDGIKQMLAHVQMLSFDRLHLVLGMVKDKEIETVLKLLPTSACYYFTQAQIPRALEATLLQQQAATFGLQGNAFQNVQEALQQALVNAGQNDLIIVCGSIFLVAEVDLAKPD